MRNEAKVCAIVLAAGMSTRMGSVKPLVSVSGRTFIERVLDNVLDSSVDSVVVVLGYEAERVRGFVFSNRVRVVVNEKYREGMASSIRAGLAVTGEVDAAMIVLADQPFVKTDTMDRILAVYRERRPKIVIPEFAGQRGNPVVVDRSLFPELLDLTGDVGARAVFGKYLGETAKVSVADRGVVVDLDSPEEIRSYVEEHEG